MNYFNKNIKRINNADKFSQPYLIIFTNGADIYIYMCVCVCVCVCLYIHVICWSQLLHIPICFSYKWLNNWEMSLFLYLCKYHHSWFSEDWPWGLNSPWDFKWAEGTGAVWDPDTWRIWWDWPLTSYMEQLLTLLQTIILFACFLQAVWASQTPCMPG